ncbi:ribonuclease HII [Gemmiger sp.]
MPRKTTTGTTSSNEALYAFDAAKRAEHSVLCGVDEAGRGPLCGPVCCAAVILNPDDPIAGVNDSKKLTEKRRDVLYEEIIQRALAYKIVFISPQEIDERNILWATMDGMAQAVAGLEITPDYVLIDGNRCPPGLIQPAEAVVKGDANSASIAAASILAKVSRDRYMLELDKEFPQYQLAKHKGYPTKLHYELIAQYGIQPFYRRSFLKKQGYWHD